MNDTIADMIPKITYKPGWKLRMFAGIRGTAAASRLCYHLEIIAEVPDARHPGQVTQIGLWRPAPSDLTPEGLITWVRGIIAEMEEHELREFLRYDGALVDDPHKMMPKVMP